MRPKPQAGHRLNQQAIIHRNSKYERRNGRTGELSHYLNGEGCQGQTGKSSQSVHHSGGVSGDGMLGRVTGITREVCLHGDGTTAATQEVVSVQAEVRVPHSSLEVPEIGMERRGAVVLKSLKQNENGAMARKG